MKISALLIGLFFCSSASAGEQKINFENVTSKNAELVSKAAGATRIYGDDLVNGNISINSDILLFRYSLGKGREDIIFMNIGRKWCGSDGCSVDIVERRGKSWVAIGGLSAFQGNIWISDREDKGYHRIINKYEIYHNADPAYKKLIRIIFKWNGIQYDTTDGGQG